MKYFPLLFVLSIVALLLMNAFGYDLGILKPSFQAGDCIYRDYSSEFNEDRFEYKVLKVGKSHYLIATIISNSNYVGKEGRSNEMLRTDLLYKKYECPDFAKE